MKVAPAGLGHPIDVRSELLSTIQSLGLPLVAIAGAAGTFVVRSAAPSNTPLGVVSIEEHRLVLRVAHGHRKANPTALGRHHAHALDRLERALEALARLDLEAASALMVASFESASSAMNSDAAGRFGTQEPYRTGRPVRGGAPGLGRHGRLTMKVGRVRRP